MMKLIYNSRFIKVVEGWIGEHKFIKEYELYFFNIYLFSITKIDEFDKVPKTIIKR